MSKCWGAYEAHESMQQMAEGNAISIDNGPKYPLVTVQVTVPHGGFSSTMAAVQAAMRTAGVPLRELSSSMRTRRKATRTTFCGPARGVDVDLMT